MTTESRLTGDLIYDSPVFFVTISANGEIIAMNDTMTRELGYTNEEVEGKDYLLILVLETERLVLSEVFQKLLKTKEPTIHEHHLITKNGQKLVVEWHFRPTCSESGEADSIIGIGIDVTDCRHAEERLEHLNRVLRTMLKINQLITEENDLNKLLQGACDNLTDNRGYYNAWIVLLDESKKATDWTESGLGSGFLPMTEKLKLGDLTRCARMSLMQAGVAVTDDPFQVCTDCPLSAMYLDRGAMTVRLKYGGKIYGLLTASIPKSLLLDQEEQSLFQEIADSIALSIHNIELQKEHQKAEELSLAQATALAARAEELQQSRQRIVAVQESLRKEIAHELHGTVQNQLIVLLHRLKELQQQIPQGELAMELSGVHQRLDELLEIHVRPMAYRLFPSILRRGLIPALQSLSDQVEEVLTIELRLDEGLMQKEKANPGLIAEQTRLAVYRIAEEALTNVVKHAKSDVASIELKQTSSNWLTLTVRDKGQGFDMSTTPGGLGLAIMLDYATVVGGTCVTRSARGEGTEVMAILPF